MYWDDEQDYEGDCYCYEIESVFEEELGEAWFIVYGACALFGECLSELDDIVDYPPHSDESLSCYCPTCGRVICANCV